MPPSSLSQLNTGAIINGCRDEARREHAQEQGYCFELFRRALEQREQAAWEAITTQYRLLILGWVSAQARELPPDEADDLAREAMEKFWRTLSARPAGIAGHFGHVGALLSYLRQCAITAVLDHRRSAQRRARLVERIQQAQVYDSQSPSMEETALERLDRDERTRRIRVWLDAHITDAQERRVLALSFEEELTPAQVAARYPTEFPSAQVVRRLKERVLKRLRRGLADLADEPPAT